ncbi:MAG: GNAT family N-acetyltransferase [Paracoccaceae bacterium]
MFAEKIETERLLLRPWVRADAPECARLIGDIAVSRWLTVVPHPYGVADALDFIENGDLDGGYCIEIDGQVAGGIGVKGHLGYWLGVGFWGQGYMSEAAPAVVAEWFSHGDGELESGYFVGNEGSKRILAGLGFRGADIVPTVSAATGLAKPLQEMLLSRGDWQARNA